MMLKYCLCIFFINLYTKFYDYIEIEISRSVVSDSLRPHGLQPTRLLCPWDSPGNSTGVDCHSLLQGIFPTPGSNPGLPHCRQLLYCLSHITSNTSVIYFDYFNFLSTFKFVNFFSYLTYSTTTLLLFFHIASPKILLRDNFQHLTSYVLPQSLRLSTKEFLKKRKEKKKFQI